MPYFSQSSLHHLRQCDKRLQDLFEEVVRWYDCTIICGHRGEVEQNRLFNQGKSKLRYPHSKHNSNPSLAVDVAPYITDKGLPPWNHKEQFYHFGGAVEIIARKMGIPIRWGGDWDRDGELLDQSFMDLVHFELWESET